MIQRALLWALDHAHERALEARRRQRSPLSYLAFAVLAGVLQAVMLAMLGGLVLVMWAAGLEPVAIVLAIVGAVPLLGPVLVRHVFVPLGAVRCAARVGHFAAAAGADPGGYAVVCAAWAALRRPSPKRFVHVEALLAARERTGDAELIAHGFLAAARGDGADARALVASAGGLVERHGAAREIAGEFLAAADLARGDLAAIRARAEASRAWPASPLTFFVEGLAARRRGQAGAPSLAELRVRWALAPHRRRTWRWLDAAAQPVAPPSVSTAPAQVVGSEPPPDALGHALAAHVAAIAGTPGPADLARAGAAWDRVFADPAAQDAFATRARALGVRDPAAAWRQLGVDVAQELGAAAADAGVPSPAFASGVAGEAAHRARHAVLDALEADLDAWRARGATLAAVDEWRAFLVLRERHAAACASGGVELRRLIFPRLYSAGSHVAVRLWNDRKEYVLSHAISQLLHAEAVAVGDAMAIEHEAAHVRMTVPIRSA